jgi:hypothetical protein
MGGYLMSLLLGFPKLAPSYATPDTWSVGDVVLPKGWDAITVDRLWIRGRPFSIEAVHGKPARLVSR